MAWNDRTSARLFDGLPFTASVINDAEAFEIAQPDPWNAASLITSPSSVSYNVSRSPHSGL